jgi:hypothetical protein
MHNTMSSMPRTDQSATVRPATIEQVHSAIDEYKKRRAAYKDLKVREAKISRQLPIAQRAATDARQEHDWTKRIYSTALTGEEPGDLLSLRAACDHAQVASFDKQRELDIVKDAHRAIQVKLEEENKSLTEALLAIQELSRRYLKMTWNRNTLWASGHESEATWRSSILSAMLGRLSNSNFEQTLELIEVLLRGSKFQAKVERGFFHIGASSNDRKCFQAGEEVSIPKHLGYQAAFEELLGGPLQFIAA